MRERESANLDVPLAPSRPSAVLRALFIPCPGAVAARYHHQIMGAGASQGLNAASNAQLAAELAATTSVPASRITPAVKEFAVRLKSALSTEDGWQELQHLFKSLRASLDEAVSSEEWGQMVYQNEELCLKYFGNSTPDEIAEQFTRLEEGKTRLDWSEFVDGAISLSATVTLAEALSTVEGEAELRSIFDTIETEDDGRVCLLDWGAFIVRDRDVLARFFGLDADASSRFQAFFMAGRVDTWIIKTFHRLGFNEEDLVTWEDFRVGSCGLATGD